MKFDNLKLERIEKDIFNLDELLLDINKQIKKLQKLRRKVTYKKFSKIQTLKRIKKRLWYTKI